MACASPTRVWECLAAAASGDVKGLLESEAGGVVSEGGGGRAVMDKAGGTGGEVAGARACQRLLVEAGAFERYGYTEMAVTCARSVLQVSFRNFSKGGRRDRKIRCPLANLRGKWGVDTLCDRVNHRNYEVNEMKNRGYHQE